MGKLAGIIVAKMAKPSGAPDDTAEADSGPSGAESAAQDILDAVKGGDVKGLAAALGAFIDLHEPSSDE